MTNPTRRYCAHRGFTLIELLLVIGIIALLAALIFPIVGSMQMGAKAAKCVGQMRQLGVGFQNYSADNDGYMMPGKDNSRWWMMFVKPYLDNTRSADNKNSQELPAIGYCPEFYKRDPYAISKKLTKASTWNTGYTMNVQLGLKSGDPYMAGKHNIIETSAVDAQYWTSRWRYTDVTYPATRALLVEGANWHITSPDPDYNRHGKDKSNIMFCDFHIETAKKARISLAITDPAQLQTAKP
jgi:prepilin-type N-terminal cleavage/methylation domain-containing protein/prepilin-type processing-associated H-X9-DG protein